MVEKKEHAASGAFWSGAITFGLVSIQVDLYSAHRPKGAALRMVDRDGTPLHRRYFCPLDHQPVDAEQTIRGFEIEAGRFIVVSDEELEALAPKKSREIDLRCFVDAAELDPVSFQHAYLLLPAGSVNKAYRLLAEIMEKSGKAGIATFVMREREHLVAIIAEGGMLRAETLRFAGEIRAPSAAGLEALGKAPAEEVNRISQQIHKLRKPRFEPDLLHDRHAQRLHELVGRKLVAGTDVVEKPAEAEGAEIIDLMAIIKSRFEPQATTGGRRKA